MPLLGPGMSPKTGSCGQTYDPDGDLLPLPGLDLSRVEEQREHSPEYLRFYDPDGNTQAVKDHVQLHCPSLSVVDVDSTTSTEAQMLRRVCLADGRCLVVHLPPWSWRPLQHELASIPQEFTNICWLRSLPKYRNKDQGIGQTALGSSRPWPPVKSTNFEGDMSNTDHLKGFLPRILHYNHTGNTQTPPAPEVMLSEPPLGTTIAELKATMSSRERRSCDWQTGQLFRRIASNVSPTGYFGMAAHVLSKRTSMPWLSDDAEIPYMRSDIGYPTWSQAFAEVFYTALEEAGRARIALPSHKLYTAFERFRGRFDHVKRPSLVAVDGCDDSHVLILQCPESKIHQSSRREIEKGSGNACADDGLLPVGDYSTGIKVTGLKSWAQLIFGDPLFASCFLGTPSLDLVKGMNTAFGTDDPLGDGDLIPHSEYAYVRLLFYQLVHIMRGLARHHKGMRTSNSAQDEDLWWARLRKALARLDDIMAQGDGR